MLLHPKGEIRGLSFLRAILSILPVRSPSGRAFCILHSTMHRPPIWYLKNVDLFAGISESLLLEMISGMIDKEYEKGRFLYTPHEEIENAYILKEGEVMLYQSVDGKKVILDVLKPGSVFGNICFEGGIKENHYAQVTQKSYICTLPHNFCLKRPEIALKGIQMLRKRLTQYEMHIRSLSALQARDRILAKIHSLNEKEDQSILPEVLRKPTKVTHEKLGEMTGLTRETVTKELQKLEQEELITVDHKHIRLTDKGLRETMALA